MVNLSREGEGKFIREDETDSELRKEQQWATPHPIGPCHRDLDLLIVNGE